MDVIKFVLSEDDAYLVPMDIFKGLAGVSSDIVLRRINSYLDNPDANTAVKRRVEEAYSDVQQKKDFYSSEELQTSVKELMNLTYSDVNAGQSKEQLEKWHSQITEILQSPFAIAYIPPVKYADLREYRQIILERSKTESPNVADVLIRLEENISKNKNLFKDAPFKGYTGTPVKRIVNDRSKYEVLLKGIEFLLKRKAEGVKPQTWRYM